MYRIGDFSILENVTVKTLRYYDEIGLFKPAIVDKYTGYRYYSEEQIHEFNKIQRYKKLGMTLEQIKELINEESKSNIIREKINELTQDVIEKEKNISILTRMLGEEKMRVEYKPYKNTVIGKKYTIKDRSEIDDKLKEIKKQLIRMNIPFKNKAFCNFELGYEKENIDCLIGYTLLDKRDQDEVEDLIIIGTGPIINYLVGIGLKNEINEIYKDMINYAHDNLIQIRGFFTEIYNNDQVEIFVEAFDLKEENKDQTYFLSHYEPTIELDETLIGTYHIREILPSIKFMANPNKQKSILDTNFKTLILNKDGTTNYDNIKWNKKELVMTINSIKIPLHIHKITYNKKEYIEVLMNESYEYYNEQRPMSYLYEKEQ